MVLYALPCPRGLSVFFLVVDISHTGTILGLRLHTKTEVGRRCSGNPSFGKFWCNNDKDLKRHIFVEHDSILERIGCLPQGDIFTLNFSTAFFGSRRSKIIASM